jgi:hypothetical protein
MLGAILRITRAGEQTLLARLVRRRPDPVAGRVACFDRNYPGYDLITPRSCMRAATSSPG